MLGNAHVFKLTLVESEIESIYYKISDNKDSSQYYSSLARNCLDLNRSKESIQRYEIWRSIIQHFCTVHA